NSTEPFRYRYKHSINTPEGMVSIVVIDAQGGANPTTTRSDRTFHRDHLGSTVAITDENGTEFLGYDAWGKRRNANGQDNNIAAWVGLSSKTDRGYTGHEHIDDIGLIHMNGRLYDPITGRMMSADPIIQAPYFLQNYNRYSYVMNNPLSLTDPSGFSWWTRWRKPILAIAVAWAIGPAGFWSQTGGIMGNAFASTMAAGFAAGGIMGGNIESAIQGAFSAALFYGVGELSGAHEAAAAGRSMTGAEHLAQTLGHAAVGCAQSSVAGGSCGQGALSAGFAAAAGPMLPGAEISAARFVSRMIVGGVASRLGGGSFESGATSAAFAYLFNELGGRKLTEKGQRLRQEFNACNSDRACEKAWIVRNHEAAAAEGLATGPLGKELMAFYKEVGDWGSKLNPLTRTMGDFLDVFASAKAYFLSNDASVFGSNAAGAFTEEAINKRVLPAVGGQKVETVRRVSSAIGEVVKRTVGN
ncbi:MAG: RHS repeat domain-containing protein, partial [Burkholderiales bacterium]